MSDSRSVASNFIWRLAERFGAQGVTYIVTIVLARLLDPSVYGTLSLVTVFTAFFQVFVDSGLGTALIQKKNVDDLDFSSVFYFNLLTCVLLYFVMFALAGPISRFYNLPELKAVIRVLSLVLIISGFKNIQQAFVARNMLFKRFFFATLGGTIAAGVIGILMAMKGFGIWALVTQYLINATIDTVILWFSVKWRPRKLFSFDRLKSLLSFGYKLLGVSLVNTLYNNIRTLVIGKIYSTDDLAYYTKGQLFPELIALNINMAVDSILLPVMAQHQDNVSDIKKMAKMSIRFGTYTIMPMMFGFAVCAPSIVKYILTEKWLPAVPYIRIFCVAFCCYSVCTSNYSAYKAMGRGDIYLRVTVLTQVISILILLVTMLFGPEMIAFGLLVSNLINILICGRYSKKILDYGVFEQIRDILPNLCLSLMMAFSVSLLVFLNLSDWIVLILQIIAGIVIYIGLSYCTGNFSFKYFFNKYCRRMK